MRYRTLGRTEFKVSEIGLGTWELDSSMWGPYNSRKVVDMYLAAIDLGVNFFDTAAVYGKSELILGTVLRLARKLSTRSLIVATKVPPVMPLWIPSPHIHAYEAFPGHHIRNFTEQSLKRLGVDCIDVQQLHAWSYMWLNEGDWEETLERLCDEVRWSRFDGHECCLEHERYEQQRNR